MRTQTPTTNGASGARRRPGLLLAGAASLALGASACGGQSGSAATDSRTPEQVLTAAYERATESSTARFALDVDATVEEESAQLDGEGAFDADAEAARMDLQVDPPDEGPVSVSVRVVDGAVYVSGLPQLAAGQWVEVPPHQGDHDLHVGEHLDPAAHLELVQLLAEDAREDGTETVRGVQARAFTGQVDVHEALEAMAPEHPVEELRAALADSGVTAVPITVYVDAEDRPVRIVQSLEAAPEGRDVQVRIVLDLYDWDARVQVEAPPADAVVPLSQLGPAQQRTPEPAAEDTPA